MGRQNYNMICNILMGKNPYMSFQINSFDCFKDSGDLIQEFAKYPSYTSSKIQHFAQ